MIVWLSAIFQDEEDDHAEVTPLTEKVAGKSGQNNSSKNPQQQQQVSNGEKEKLNNTKSSSDNNVVIYLHFSN